MGSLRRELLRETHDTKWVSHLGEKRALALLARSYYWLKTGDDVQAYVRSCLVCQLDKMERKKFVELLQPLLIPEKPWESISIDFVKGFIKVHEFRLVFVIVDRFSKYVVFVLALKACPTEEATKLFFNYVVKYCGLLKDIVSDRDVKVHWKVLDRTIQALGFRAEVFNSKSSQNDG